ncbi:MAG: OmpA family [Actinomycetota bacterium]
MKKLLVAFAVSALTFQGVANAADYSFPTAMTVTIEKDKVPAFKEGSNVVYSVVNYFTVLMPNGDQSFTLTNAAGEELPVAQEGDRYFINADVRAGEVVYFGPDTQTFSSPVRVMMNGPINLGHVHFASASAKLTVNAKKALRLMAQEMASSNLTSAYLVGSTDRAGSNDANLTLAEKRANAAASYLQKKLAALGVAKYVISSETMGEYLSDKKDGTVNLYDRKVSVLIYPTV